jgi:archaellum component FlaF (FlaF/FlaG flagellin family)
MNFGQARNRRGLATVITSAIMMSAVCVLGSAGVVWSQSSLTTQQVEMTNTVENYSNKLNESLSFEYVYCNSSPCETIIVIVTNNGRVGLAVTEISISDKNSGFNKIHVVSSGSIGPDQSIVIPVNDPAFASHNVLEVTSKTSRGNFIQTQITI